MCYRNKMKYMLLKYCVILLINVTGGRTVNMIGGERIPRGTTMVGAERKNFLKIDDSRSLEMAFQSSIRTSF